MNALALSIGDPSGIGPEIVLKAWLRREECRIPPFYVLADPKILTAWAHRMKLDVSVAECFAQDAAGLFRNELPVVPLQNPMIDSPGKPSVGNATAILEAIARGAEHAMSGEALGLVTAPIAKKTLYDAGFRFPGHTEYLGHLAEEKTGSAVQPVMLLAGPDLRTVPVTLHQPLASVPRTLTSDIIIQTARIVADDMKNRFGIAAPRLAIAGLNPHAGEDGALGKEDSEIIAPAVARLVSDGVHAFGPLPADTMFHARARATYDVALCMYHDQALIPVKALAFDETVNVTLGLPFIRTSPDHGTAFDIAGRGIAREDSLIAALKLANRLADSKGERL